jgi:hypothetical protein
MKRWRRWSCHFVIRAWFVTQEAIDDGYGTNEADGADMIKGDDFDDI